MYLHISAMSGETCCCNMNEALNMRDEFGGTILNIGKNSCNNTGVPVINDGRGNFLFLVFRDGTTLYLGETRTGAPEVYRCDRAAKVILKTLDPDMARSMAMEYFRKH